MNRLLKLLFSLTLFFSAAAAQASTVLDVQSMLARPGVRLVVVEFYATWCKPCMDAIPRWDALHKKYYDEGLRLIVVNTQDPNGLCGSPGWTPDDMVCDIDGGLAKRMGALDLPAAYLWSWQGNLLVQRGHVDKVEKEVERFFKQNPRVLVESPVKGKAGDYLVNLARETLSRDGKFMVVASDAEAKLAAQIRKKSYEASKRKDTQCKLGQELAANSLVQVNLIQKRLTMQLFSAESGCLLQGAGVRYNWKKPEQSMAEVTAKLLGQLKSPNLEMPKILQRQFPAAASMSPVPQRPSKGSMLSELDARTGEAAATPPSEVSAPEEQAEQEAAAPSEAEQATEVAQAGVAPTEPIGTARASASGDLTTRELMMWSSGGLSAATLGAGFYVLSLANSSAAEAATLAPGTLQAALDADHYTTLSYSLLGAGAALGAAALYFYLGDGEGSTPDAPPTITNSSSVRVSGFGLTPLEEGLFVMLQGGF